MSLPKNSKQPPSLAFDCRHTPTAWRKVDLSTTKRIAYACMSGIDFTGSNKSDIYECVAKPPSSIKSDPHKFAVMMHAAAALLPSLQQRLNEKLNETLKRIEDEFDARQSHK